MALCWTLLNIKKPNMKIITVTEVLIKICIGCSEVSPKNENLKTSIITEIGLNDIRICIFEDNELNE